MKAKPFLLIRLPVPWEPDHYLELVYVRTAAAPIKGTRPEGRLMWECLSPGEQTMLVDPEWFFECGGRMKVVGLQEAPSVPV